MKTEFLGPVILYLCRSPKSREGDDFTWYIMERRKRQWHLEIPDVALDYHTERGRKMGRGQTHWFEEASKLENAVGGNKYAELVKDLVEGK
jgi:replication-associated recombination protein RarA